jgi:hypothetical protein
MAKRRRTKARRTKSPVRRAGLPAEDSVREVIEKVAPTGMRFRILRTTEVDAYEKRAAPGKRPRPS